MEGTSLTREEALRRFQSAKQIKQACIERMKCELSSVYEKQTGKKVDYLFILRFYQLSLLMITRRIKYNMRPIRVL